VERAAVHLRATFAAGTGMLARPMGGDSTNSGSVVRKRLDGARSRRLLLFLLTSAAAACPRPEGPKNWEEALRAADARQAVYSPAFNGAPPEGEFFLASLHPGQDAASACGRFGDGQPPTSDFWYLLLTTNRNEAGQYSLVPDVAGGEGRRASFRAIHVKDWKREEDIPAVGGALVLEAVPAETEEFKAGKKLGGHLSAEFPKNPIQQVECSGEGVPGGDVRQWCTCRDQAGQTSQCESDGGNCCIAWEGERTVLDFDIEAAPCPAMCVAPPGFWSEYCGPLR
jgi:hypothetical protein